MAIKLPGIDDVPAPKAKAPAPKARNPRMVGSGPGNVSNSIDPHGPMYARQDPPRKPPPKAKPFVRKC